ncbi:hypothetical protein CCY99_05600 [Helicobacter sp. 16-1353]|uniref:hypothetical protein n=1 Tax=Helicobacter sp. 16-1353 TaxID=2004996 RepID=UPI000DCCC264|nr:hypothetical protein [Helicobacter sp. 16-1353]RAX53856.1 hypothetical protein CCY99_05600 [Helicobacter sp. 16-1353]
MNQINRYFFLNTYHTNPPKERLDFEKLLNDKNSEDEILTILIACNQRNIQNYLKHSMIKKFCNNLAIEIDEDSIKKLQNEAILRFLQSNNKSRILNLISKLKNNNIIFYEEEQNIRISLGGDKNISFSKSQPTPNKIDFSSDNVYLNFTNNIRNKIEDSKNIYLKNKTLEILDNFIKEKIFSIAVLGLEDSGKQTLIKALNETNNIDKTNAILHISNTESKPKAPSKNILEILAFYDKNNMEIERHIKLESYITKQNIDMFSIPAICNPYTKIYAQNIINNASLILYLIDVNKKINNKDIEIIAGIFKENKSLAIVWTHFDLINPNTLKTIKKSVVKKLYEYLKRYNISEIEIQTKIDFICTASNISLMYLQNREDLALSKGFRVQDSGIYELQKYIKSTLFSEKNTKSISKEILFRLNSAIKIYIQNLQKEPIDFHIDDDLIQSYKNNLEIIKNNINHNILVSLNIIFESISQDNSKANKKILLKIKITDLLNNIFKMGEKDFEKINLQFLHKIKHSNELNKKQLEVVILKLNILKSHLKKIFVLDNKFLISQIIETLNENENLNSKDILITKKVIMENLCLESKIDSALKNAKNAIDSITNILEMRFQYSPNEIKDRISQARQLLNSLIVINNEYN